MTAVGTKPITREDLRAQYEAGLRDGVGTPSTASYAAPSPTASQGVGDGRADGMPRVRRDVRRARDHVIAQLGGR